MKKICRIIGIIALGTATLLGLFGYRARAASPQYVIKMSVLAPEESSWSDMTRKIKQFVESRTRGRVKIIWYMSGVMGDEPEEIEKMKRGELHAAGFTIVGMGMILPEVRVLLLPFLTENYAEVDYIIDSMFPEFQRRFEEKGYVLMGFTEVGYPRLFTQEPIRSIDDLARVKIWTWAGEDLTEAIIRDLGFTRIFPLSLFKAKAALEQGTVDAYYSPCYAQVGLQWYHHAKYMSNFRIGYTPAALVMDKRFFDGLPADVRYILQQSINFLLKPFREIIRKEEESACRGLVKRGIVEYQTPPDVIDELRRRSREGYFKYADKKYPRDFLEEILGKLEVFRSKK